MRAPRKGGSPRRTSNARNRLHITPAGSELEVRLFKRGLTALAKGRFEPAWRAFEAAASGVSPLASRAKRILRRLKALRASHTSVRRRELQRLFRIHSDLRELTATGPTAIRKRPALRRAAPRKGAGVTGRSGPRKRAGARSITSGQRRRSQHAITDTQRIATTHGVAYGVRVTTKEVPRYTDVTVYEDHLYRGDDLSAASRVADDAALVVGRRYTLEVAIRARRTGIEKDQAPPRSVINPRQGTERVSVYVLANPTSSAIRVKEPLTKIAWPFGADSDSALFCLEVAGSGSDAPVTSSIDLSLYDARLDLLDVVRVSLPIVTEDDAPVDGLPPASLTWLAGEPAAVRADPNAPRRDLAIVVRSIHGGFEFNFLLRRRSGGVVKVSITRRISDADLESLLKKVRDFWTDLVITNYADRLTVTKGTFTRYLETLRDLGVEAWTLLFGARYGDQEGASETAGTLLASLELSDGAYIQIDCADAEDFVFPWSVLYPPAEDSAAADPLRFWGARYQVEQVTRGPRSDGLTDSPVKILFALDPAFGNSDAERALLEQYQAASDNRLQVTSPISDEPGLVSELISDPAAHLLYFYCHGYAATEGRFLGRSGVELLRQKIEALPSESPERGALETLLRLTARMGNESWIHIGGAEITESRLKRHPFFKKRRPIVFLNMCQSADLLPAMSSGLVRVFLDHNASAVLGTESPMTAVFAHVFAQAIFDALLRGDAIGTALWKARRYFLAPERRNPLGLSYTLYGRGVATLGGGPLIASRSTP